MQLLMRNLVETICRITAFAGSRLPFRFATSLGLVAAFLSIAASLLAGDDKPPAKTTAEVQPTAPVATPAKPAPPAASAVGSGDPVDFEGRPMNVIFEPVMGATMPDFPAGKWLP